MGGLRLEDAADAGEARRQIRRAAAGDGRRQNGQQYEQLDVFHYGLRRKPKT